MTPFPFFDFHESEREREKERELDSDPSLLSLPSLSTSFYPSFSSSSLSSSISSSGPILLSFFSSTGSYVESHLSEAVSVAANRLADYVNQTTVGTVTTHEMIIRNDHPWARISMDLSAEICSFLTAKELCVFAQVDKFAWETYRYLTSETTGFWSREFSRRFASSLAVSHSISLVKYIHSNLIESRTELNHFLSLQNHYQAIYQYNQSKRFSRSNSGIIGLVCDIAWTDSPLLSAVLSKKRYMTMSTILTHTIAEVRRFKKVIQSDTIRSFLPVTSTPSSTVDFDLERVRSDDLVYPGFIGYAVNLIRLPSQYEHLRYTVFWGLFRDLMVFEDRTASELYSRNLTPEEMVKFWVVTLQDYSDEILETVYPRLSAKIQRSSYSKANNETTRRQLEDRLINANTSFSIARCTY